MTDIAGITAVVNGPVTHVVNGTAIVNLVVHHVVPGLCIIVIALLHILDVGIKVKVGNDAFEHVPEQSITALTRIDGVEGNTDFINQFRYSLGIAGILAVAIPHVAVVVSVVIEFCRNGRLSAIQHKAIAVLARSA